MYNTNITQAVNNSKKSDEYKDILFLYSVYMYVIIIDFKVYTCLLLKKNVIMFKFVEHDNYFFNILNSDQMLLFISLRCIVILTTVSAFKPITK